MNTPHPSIKVPEATAAPQGFSTEPPSPISNSHSARPTKRKVELRDHRRKSFQPTIHGISPTSDNTILQATGRTDEALIGRSHVGRVPLESMIDHARREAHAIAATTPYPSLVLPCLLEEKVNQARAYHQRQHDIWIETRRILSFAD